MSNLFIELITLSINITYIYIVAFFKAILPSKYLTKKSLKDKKILLTGSASGLGRKLAIEFAKLGAELILWDVNESENEETLRILWEEVGQVKAKCYRVDLSSYKEINETAEVVKNEFGKIDILVNNAGLATGKLILDCSEENIEMAFAVNIKSHFHTVRNFLPAMLAENDGHIVTIASVSGKLASAGLADYTATKHAAVGFHDSLVSEIALTGKDSVKTTLVCPYYTHSAMFDAKDATTRFPKMFPILDPDYVVSRIIEAIQLNSEFLVTPRAFYYVIATVGLMPSKVQQLVGIFCGLPQSIERFNRAAEKK